jgi:hypothetical protein
MGAGDLSASRRGEKLSVEFGVEGGDSLAVGGEGVGVGVGDGLDEPVKAKTAPVVGHLTVAVVGVEQPGDEPAEAVVGEAGDGVDDTPPSRLGHEFVTKKQTCP